MSTDILESSVGTGGRAEPLPGKAAVWSPPLGHLSSLLDGMELKVWDFLNASSYGKRPGDFLKRLPDLFSVHKSGVLDIMENLCDSTEKFSVPQ